MSRCRLVAEVYLRGYVYNPWGRNASPTSLCVPSRLTSANTCLPSSQTPNREQLITLASADTKLVGYLIVIKSNNCASKLFIYLYYRTFWHLIASLVGPAFVVPHVNMSLVITCTAEIIIQLKQTNWEMYSWQLWVWNTGWFYDIFRPAT